MLRPQRVRMLTALRVTRSRPRLSSMRSRPGIRCRCWRRVVNDANRAGVWSFHCSESTLVPGMDSLLRHAAIRLAESAEGKSTEVEVAICRPGDPAEKWIPVGKGVAVYEAER